jgi:hypothetical protein
MLGVRDVYCARRLIVRPEDAASIGDVRSEGAACRVARFDGTNGDVVGALLMDPQRRGGRWR